MGILLSGSKNQFRACIKPDPEACGVRYHFYSAVCNKQDKIQIMGSDISACGMANEETEVVLPASNNMGVVVTPGKEQGETGQRFDSMIQPLLDVSGFDVHVHKTTGVLDARDVSENIDPVKFSALIVVGGDGTVSEVLTGILRREDHQNLLENLPIAVIPTGSNNKSYKNLIKNQSSMNLHQEPFSNLSAEEKADNIISETTRILKHLDNSTGIEKLIAEDREDIL